MRLRSETYTAKELTRKTWPDFERLFGNQSTHGSLSMFEKQGFKPVGRYGLNNVVVRKIVTSGETRAREARNQVSSKGP